MKAGFWLVTGFLVLMGFSYYVAFGETGPIGWINAGQVAVFGGYSRRISMFVLMAVVCIPVLLIWVMVAPASLQGRAKSVSAVLEAPLGPPPKAGTAIKWVLSSWLGLTALAWAGAYGYGAWEQHVRSADAAATYTPIELAPSMKDAAAGHDHLAVRGRLLADHVVARKTGNDGTEAMTLMPVVEPGWREGDPVHFVVRSGTEGESALRGALRRPQDSLLVRTDGSVPTLAGQVFERMGAPLADDAIAVVLVAEQAGATAQRADTSSDDLVTRGAIGTGIVTIVFALISAGLVGSAREERKRATRRAAGAIS